MFYFFYLLLYNNALMFLNKTLESEMRSMYTLLIADDEDFTREGIISDIPLKELGIEKVLQADNGINALAKIANCPPDIVLTDIRMPRMDGIEMVYEIRKKHPDTIIIFMSGYSDTCYLKSAITLQAVQYVDKPIALNELTKALTESVRLCDKKRRMLASRKSDLALHLLYPQKNKEIVINLLDALSLSELHQSNCLTFILKLLNVLDEDVLDISLIKESILELVSEHFKSYSIELLCAFKSDDCLIGHLIEKKKNILTQTYLNGILKELSKKLVLYPHQISVGSITSGIHKIQNSYTSAVLSLQGNFFDGINSISYYRDEHKTDFLINDQIEDHLEELLLSKNREGSINLVKELTQSYFVNNGTLIKYVKDSYYRLITKILHVAERKKVSLLFNLKEERFIWDIISNINCLQELESITIDCLITYFNSTIDPVNNNNVVTEIKASIDRNISNYNLSIDLISSSLHLTPTYLCYIFKQETGETINQYITAQRMEIAKTHLKNGRLKVTEVASKIGMDNNYFSKVFKKQPGLSPSEYRQGDNL